MLSTMQRRMRQGLDSGSSGMRSALRISSRLFRFWSDQIVGRGRIERLMEYTFSQWEAAFRASRTQGVAERYVRSR